MLEKSETMNRGTQMEAIRTENITKSFGTHEVLKGINLTLHQGEVFTLLGENGAGKSTLINILTTLSKPSSGSAWVLGYDIQTHSDAIRQLISLNSQSITLDDEFTGYNNLKLIANLIGIDNFKERIEAVSKRLHLPEFINKKVGTYSGGMKRRLDIAASLLGDAKILFLDEPTTGVDPKNRIEIWQVINELREEGKTIFLTTQYLEEADRLSDTIAFIKDGRISLVGTPKQLKKQARNQHKVVIPTESAVLAAEKLKDAGISFTENNGAIEVENSDLQTALKILVAADIEIEETLPVELSLEEIFLDMTGEDDK